MAIKGGGLPQAKKLAKQGAKAYAPKCIFCQAAHPAHLCTLSCRERRDKIFAQKRCMNCLRDGHFANGCRQPPCKVCKSNHNTLIRVIQNKKAGIGKFPLRRHTSVPNNLRQAVEFTDKKATPKSEKMTSVSISGATNCANEKALMMCCYAMALNLNTFCTKQVSVFVDSGSSESYITTRAAKALNLPIGDEHEMKINRFGDSKGSGEPMQLVTYATQFGLKGDNGDTFSVEGLVVNRMEL